MKARKEEKTETAGFPNIFEKETAFAALIYLTITLAVFWPAVLNPTQVIPAANLTVASYNARFDVYDSLWDLWWTGVSVLGMHASPYFTSLVFYPFGADLSTQTLMPLSGLIAAPLQALGLAFEYNVLLISGFVLSALFTYFLGRYLVKDRVPSFLAGIVFAFSAVNISHAYIFLDWASVEWIPLFILFLLLVLRTNRPRYMLGASASLFLISFMGTLEEGLMLVVFAAVLLYFGIFSGWKKEILSKRFMVGIAAMSIIAIIISAPLLLPLLHNAFSTQALQPETRSSTLSSVVAWSDSISSFFLPSQFNGIFSGTASAYQASLGNSGYEWEGISYIGYTVILLCLIALYYDFKKKQLSSLLIWISLIIFFGWLSLGPLIKISGSYTGIPGIYLIYSLIPVLNVAREPGRFDIFVSLCLAIVSAYGLMYLLKNPALKDRWKRIAVASAASILILIECTGLPASQQFVSQYYANVTISPGYYAISSAPNATALVLPVQNGGQAMYYQTAFRKPIIGGYTSRSTLFQELYPYYIPMASIYSPSLPSNNSQITLNYPIIENYTQADLMLLSEYNISYIAVIKGAYNASELAGLNSGIDALSGSMAYNDSSTSIYAIAKADPASYETSNTAFISSGLYPEDYLNGNGDPGVWWIVGIANITVYSTTAQNATFCANLTSAVNGSIYAEDNGDMLGYGAIYAGNDSYSKAFALKKGYNVLGFYPGAVSESQQQINPYLEIGFSKIRILYNDNSAQCAI